jgi:hypothetical protein
VAFLVHAPFSIRKIVLLLKSKIMSNKVIINAKGSAALKEAIKIVAFEERGKLSRSGSSALIIQILEKDPRIAKQLQKLKKFPIGNQ